MLAGATKKKTDNLDAERLSFHDLTGVWLESFVVSDDLQELRMLIVERNHYAKLATQAKTVQTKLDNALAKIKAMKAPFALNYSDSSCKVAIDALGELDDALGELSETLKGYSGNETVEAQCQVINENYVDNVVVATYRLLADNAQKLYQSIVNIKQ